jgi:glucose-6-phosphate isomerase
MDANIDQIDAIRSALVAHANSGAPSDMRAAFADDAQRFERFSVRLDDLLLDYSKCRVDAKAISLLTELAHAAGLEEKRAAMFSGQAINTTENRAVLHVALRNRSGLPILVDGDDVMPEVEGVLAAMARFSEGVRTGAITGATGRKFTDVVNIGIGGSDLGPVMATLALAPYADGPRLHYVSNVDGAHIHDTLAGLKAETTLIVVASKTFTTIETMTNAETARDWLAGALGEAAIGAHFAAVSTALDKVGRFNIAEERVFGFWDWVGGRYSLWGAIGLPIMIAVGPTNFLSMLDGAQRIDNHFRDAPMTENLPVMLGLIGYWHRVAEACPTRAVIPYDQRLARLPAYLQQLDMESNGKSVKMDGSAVAGPTGPVVFGEPGTNGQHAFFQLLHQGTDTVPVEFIVAANGHEADLQHQHQLLLANCLAQSEALMKGRTLEEATAQLSVKGVDPERAAQLAPHRVFSGNRPSLTIMYDRLTPFALGRLIALYEHRVFVESVLFGINAFDQWGVELGKELATGLQAVVAGEQPADDRDASTRGLIGHLLALRA